MCWSGLLSEDLYWVIDPILGLIWQTNRELSPGDCINSSPYILTICHANTWSETLIQQALFIVILWFAPASRCDNFSYADWQPICFFGFHVDENYVRNTLYMLYSDTCHTFCFGTLWQLCFFLCFVFTVIERRWSFWRFLFKKRGMSDLWTWTQIFLLSLVFRSRAVAMVMCQKLGHIFPCNVMSYVDCIMSLITVWYIIALDKVSYEAYWFCNTNNSTPIRQIILCGLPLVPIL